VETDNAFIREVILENFMSYEYGRILFKPGLNLITGPNGAGKSTILIAISVALGQTFTERARKLSDLVRRGKDMARVTLILDNSPRNGKRPLPFRKDTVLLSRYIKKDGSYWYEMDYREVSKVEVVDTLRRLGLNPENLLVIMPQGFVDRFIVMSPEEKLKMVEDAVGIASIRQDLREAKERLESILKDEEEYQGLLEKAVESMEKWKEQYDKLVEYRRLRKRLEELKVERAWALVDKAEKALVHLEERKGRAEKELSKLEGRLEEESSSYLKAEKGIELAIEELIQSLGPLQERARRVGYNDALLSTGKGNGDRKEEEELAEELSAYLSRLRSLTALADELASWKGRLEVTKYRISKVKEEIRKIGREIAEAKDVLERARRDAELLSARPAEVRTVSEVEDEERLVNAQLKAIGAVAEEAERVYLEFKEKIEEYKERLEEVRSNKEEALKEIAERSKEWRRVIKEVLNKIDREFQQILSTINSHGHVELINDEDPEKAGLMLKLGLKGLSLVPLDSYTQSGGEKSAAVMAFLLATQRHILSPFRAVDEFDVHMDPVNRELFFKAIHSYFKGERGSQYVIITPGYPPFFDPETHYIMVQKTVKGSELKVISGEAR
jgi:chromosome segregation ATPase